MQKPLFVVVVSDGIIRQRLTTDPGQFLQAVDGAVDDPATLYHPHIVR